MGLSQAPRAKEICTRTGKEKYTKSQAKSLAKRIQRQSGQLVSAFLCPFCGKWHTGKKSRWT